MLHLCATKPHWVSHEANTAVAKNKSRGKHAANINSSDFIISRHEYSYFPTILINNITDSMHLPDNIQKKAITNPKKSVQLL